MRVRPLLAGEIQLSSSFPRCPPGRLGPYRAMLDQLRRRDTDWAPVPVFLLEHPTRVGLRDPRMVRVTAIRERDTGFEPARSSDLSEFQCRSSPVRPVRHVLQ